MQFAKTLFRGNNDFGMIVPISNGGDEFSRFDVILQKFRHSDSTQQGIKQVDTRHFDFMSHIKIDQRRDSVVDDHRPSTQGNSKDSGAVGYRRDIGGGVDDIGLFVDDDDGDGGKSGLHQDLTYASVCGDSGGGK